MERAEREKLPLFGIRVLEFTHAVMGPTTGLLLADMGAEVIHIEPTDGDPTRKLKGFGTGYFYFYNRNKKSLAIDLKSEQGKKIIYELASECDVLVENFGPGTMDKLGFSFEKIKSIHPGIIYCSLKGFLSGPYEHRIAMDEVVQMMGGLAYMTGRSGDPLRAGTSIVDITGGMFGYIGILLSLIEKQKTGQGRYVKSALFETTAFLMGQHMVYSALSESRIPPMPERISAWSIYNIFDTLDSQKIFIGIISEKQWTKFCTIFRKEEWLNDPRFGTNNLRIDHKEELLPQVVEIIKSFPMSGLVAMLEKAGIPFAPIAHPEDLFTDPHLNANGSLVDTCLENQVKAPLPIFPLQWGEQRTDTWNDAPAIGEHTYEILLRAGFSPVELESYEKEGIIVKTIKTDHS
ncbi:MAG TPA: CaiB/BaiF CoA-transferase family protein [Saprospiraceae bacterium]|nr:CaiB/BaiF CoA-transferase family protein [Saprospiraceae bacterium]